MTNESARTTVALMAANGLKPYDIALALGISEQQVRQWLQREPPKPDPTPPEAA